MPNVDAGRQKVLDYMEENNISITDLSVVYGMKKQDLANYLNGKLDTVKGNQVILRIIADYRIR
ncbi:hypothetical protein A5819_003437 [Enterococcus sp. 7E2_DIV0204]|uniref:hypothetical protein n=1 Tax=unclassified Enterococcus TaxID=2608891 RepID=UPI000A32DF80|nr:MULTISPECIES: hypothetical protein [unclassified Enterococcus]OTN86587.1 hypothetical protein A5819_003437 [Enterococcus sp. 7E2_DIV0204]OTP47624.1 hypothetical protein A5884_003379 [Enterococcus sp. 7D2_DIV0200]